MDRGSTLQKYDYYQGPKKLGEMWAMVRDPATLQCALSTHALGWEIRLKGGSNFSRSQVCKTQQEVFDTSDAWKAEAAAKGWR